MVLVRDEKHTFRQKGREAYVHDQNAIIHPTRAKNGASTHAARHLDLDPHYLALRHLTHDMISCTTSTLRIPGKNLAMIRRVYDSKLLDGANTDAARHLDLNPRHLASCHLAPDIQSRTTSTLRISVNDFATIHPTFLFFFFTNLKPRVQ